MATNNKNVVGDIQNLITKKAKKTATQKGGTPKLTGQQASKLVSKYGSPAVSTALAKQALANPDLQIGSNVKGVTGLKIKGEGENRVATYDPSRIPSRGNRAVSTKQQQSGLGYPLGLGKTRSTDYPFAGTPGGTDWYRTGSGAYRYGGPAGTPFAPATTADTADTAGVGSGVGGEVGGPPDIPYKQELNLEDILAGIEKLFASRDQQEMLRADLARKAAGTLTGNMARASLMPDMRIAPASQASQLAGTQPFKYTSGPYAPGAVMKQPDVLNI